MVYVPQPYLPFASGSQQQHSAYTTLPPAASTTTTTTTTTASAIAGVPVHSDNGGYDNDQNHSGDYNSKPPSTAVVGGASVISHVPSSTCLGGPTRGLVSEGQPNICHKVGYEIKGHEMQLVEVALDQQGTVIAEAGGMMYMEDGIEFKTKFGDGSTPNEELLLKLTSAGGRLMMGESLFIAHFSNKGQAKALIAFAVPYPGTLLPINL